VVSKEDRAKFLSKLGNYKHFSVFAHSFAYKDLNELEEDKINKYLEKEFQDLPKPKKAEILALKIASTHFKSHYNPKYPSVIGVSLRHYLEDLLEYSESEYFKAFEKIAEYDVAVEPLGKKEKTTLIGLLREYDGYAVFYIDNVSRVMTHQLVRHTALNFSQRSQRYVREDENQLIIPPSVKSSNCHTQNRLEDCFEFIEHLINEIIQDDTVKEDIKRKLTVNLDNYKKDNLKLKDIFNFIDMLSQTVYNYAVYKCKVKREDGRFILPHGRKTTIVVSGTLSWLKDFIIKRVDPSAQWEIRQVANEMKELLEAQGIVF
jgi:thymidylate synthase (FAD)